MPWMMGGGQPIPAGLSYPHLRLWSSDCVQIMKMTFKCNISENDENTLKFRHFLHVYNNQSLEMPWMTGGGQPIPAGLSCPPPMIFEQWLAIDFVVAVNCFNNYKLICFTKCIYCLLVYKTHFLKFIHIQVGGNISQLVYLTPHLRFWKGDCLQIMKWLWSITLFKMMKFLIIQTFSACLHPSVT